MQLQTIRLHPFAGLANRTHKFAPGMNVVLGPNEAGKSTMVNGILCALFESTSYGRVHWRKHLQQFIPRGGGDTFGVSVDCLVGGKPYQITKSWGGECRCDLTLPSGQVIRGADEVDQQVASLLKLKRGTWQNILIAHQSAIPSTLKDFNTSSEEVSNLAQILRSSAFDTDGVSIEKLDRAINEQLNAVSSRWDLTAERPENGRGIENPWIQGVGTLLNVWYEHERLKNEHLEVEAYERNLDAINQQVTELIAERNELQLYVDKFKPIIDGLKERQGLELKLHVAKKNEERLRNIQSKWPQHESELSRLKDSLKDLADKHTALREELSQAQSYQESAAQREKLKSAKEAAENLGEEKKNFDAFKGLSTQLFQGLKAAFGDRDRHAASMAAGKLQVRFIPESDTKVNIKAGLEDSREETVTKAQPLHTEADGVVTLTADQFRLEVESGDGQFSAIQEKYESAQGRIRDLLSAIGVASLDEANKRETDYSNAKTNLERAKTALETILSGQTLAELESTCGDEVSAPKREIEEINNAILDNREKHNKQQDDVEAKRSDIKCWEGEFKTQDAVL
ncbi:MAG: AAA family ATPase, partial [Polaribacter sp.]|nr:AAA family ATPase [Polaribacter sp.]